MDIGQRMKKRRVELKLLPKDVALRTGVSVSTYREWENGRKISGEPYVKLASALSMNINDLLGIENTNVQNFAQNLDLLEEQVKIIRSSFIQFF